VHCYEFARILEAAGEEGQAKMMLAEFLRRYDLEQRCDVSTNPRQAAEIKSALAPMVAYAKAKLGPGAVP
jgi:hypothetical protein